MTFGLPWLLAGAGVAAAAVLALHFLAWDRPPAKPLPTSRFVPARSERAAVQAKRPLDLLLLLLRVLALVIAGFALADPRPASPHGRVVRVVVVDQSRAVGNVAELRDSVRAVLREGDVLVSVDSVARVVSPAQLDSLRRSRSEGSLSLGFVAAGRQLARLRGRADSVELVVVSPFAAETWDAGTLDARRSWRGRVRAVRVSAARDSTHASVMVRANGDDPVAAGAALAGYHGGANASARVLRVPPSATDSAWARSGGALVVWPVNGAPSGWPARARADTAYGVLAGPRAIALRAPRTATAPATAAAIASWIDGEPAAIEKPLGDGCIREVGIRVPAAGDLTLRESFRSLLDLLVAPCGGARRFEPLPADVMRSITGAGPLLSTSSISIQETRRPLAIMMLIAAATILLIEPVVRRFAR